MKLHALLYPLLVAIAILGGSEYLKVGDVAPDFLLPYATKDTIDFQGIRLSDLIGEATIILAFYPADWSGGCTKQMCTMRDRFKDLESLGAKVLAISGDYVFSHREWARYHDLQFALLSDHKHEVANMYASYNPDTGFNRRTVYVIDRAGIIRYIDPAYKPGMSESFDRLYDAVQAASVE